MHRRVAGRPQDDPHLPTRGTLSQKWLALEIIDRQASQSLDGQ
jgi:hypothetical protein